MFNVGDKVCLAIDNSVVGVVISVIPSAGAATRYQVFHDATNMAIYFENQLKLITDSHGSKKLSLHDHRDTSFQVYHYIQSSSAYCCQEY